MNWWDYIFKDQTDPAKRYETGANHQRAFDNAWEASRNAARHHSDAVNMPPNPLNPKGYDPGAAAHDWLGGLEGHRWVATRPTEAVLPPQLAQYQDGRVGEGGRFGNGSWAGYQHARETRGLVKDLMGKEIPKPDRYEPEVETLNWMDTPEGQFWTQSTPYPQLPPHLQRKRETR